MDAYAGTENVVRTARGPKTLANSHGGNIRVLVRKGNCSKLRPRPGIVANSNFHFPISEGFYGYLFQAIYVEYL